MAGRQNFVGEREELIFNAFINLEPVQRSEDGCDMRRFRSFNHSAHKTVLNLLEPIYLKIRKIVVESYSLEWTIEAAMVLAVLEWR